MFKMWGEDRLRHAVGAVRGNIRDVDAALAGGFQIDVVVARGEHADVFEVRQFCKMLRVQNDLVGKHGVGVGAAFEDERGGVLS